MAGPGPGVGEREGVGDMAMRCVSVEVDEADLALRCFGRGLRDGEFRERSFSDVFVLVGGLASRREERSF